MTKDIQDVPVAVRAEYRRRYSVWKFELKRMFETPGPDDAGYNEWRHSRAEARELEALRNFVEYAEAHDLPTRGLGTKELEEEK